MNNEKQEKKRNKRDAQDDVKLFTISSVDSLSYIVLIWTNAYKNNERRKVLERGGGHLSSQRLVQNEQNFE